MSRAEGSNLCTAGSLTYSSEDRLQGLLRKHCEECLTGFLNSYTRQQLRLQAGKKTDAR